MKNYTAGEIKKMLSKDGWYLVRVTDHYQYKHPTKKGTVSVPHHGDNKALGVKTLYNIFRQAGWR